MNDFCRKLEKNIDIEYFVDGILCVEEDEEKEVVINKIAEAERNIRDYEDYSTLRHKENRHHSFRDEKVRKRLRNQIIEELFDQNRIEDDDLICLHKGGAKPNNPISGNGIAFYLIGPPASGKSTIAAKIAEFYGCYILDSDFAKRKLPEYGYQIGAASLVHEESNAIIFGENGLMDRCLGKNLGLVIPKIGHDIGSIIVFCEGLKKAGYKVYLISVDLDRQKATQRAYNRYVKTHRYVPLSLIFDGYGNQPSLNYFKLKQQWSKLFDGFAQISTDVHIDEPVLVIENSGIDDFEKIDWR